MSLTKFLDTNVLVYANSQGDHRTETAIQVLLNGGVVGVQALNEFVSVARSKLAMTWPEVQEAVASIVLLCPDPIPLTIDMHLHALTLSRQRGLSIWDSLILAAAIEAGCTTLVTEDLQHGQIIEGVRIENPFLQRQTP